MQRYFRLFAGMIVGAVALPITLLSPAAAGVVVAYESQYSPGTIVIETSERALYLVMYPGEALRYSVGVGRPGRQWTGEVLIDGKYLEPNWAPPDAVLLDKPSLPRVIAGGSPANPLGVAAMTLSGGEYAIHGTNSPKSIGGFVSYGCIRMFNADITDLYRRVDIGTKVVVTR